MLSLTKINHQVNFEKGPLCGSEVSTAGFVEIGF